MAKSKKDNGILDLNDLTGISKKVESVADKMVKIGKGMPYEHFRDAAYLAIKKGALKSNVT